MAWPLVCNDSTAWWLVKSNIPPCCTWLASKARKLSRDCASKATKGSSNTHNFAAVTDKRAKAVRRFCPCDNTRNGKCARLFNPIFLNASMPFSWGKLRPATCASNNKFSIGVKSSLRDRLWSLHHLGESDDSHGIRLGFGLATTCQGTGGLGVPSSALVHWGERRPLPDHPKRAGVRCDGTCSTYQTGRRGGGGKKVRDPAGGLRRKERAPRAD